MKHLSHFLSEKSNKLLCIAILLFTFLRFPSLFEPYWYGDEGIYQAIGRSLNNGMVLYSGVWDNKPPLLYFLYGIADGNQFLVRFISLIFGIISVVLFYRLSQLLLGKKLLAPIITIIFAVFFASPYIEGNIANAENFMLLPIFLGILLILQHIISNDHQKVFVRNKALSLILGGLLLGISFMTKIVGIFDIFAISIFVLMIIPFKQVGKPLIYIYVGFIIPVILLSGYFLSLGIFDKYISAIFSSNVSYVGYENYFLFPQGLLILKLALLSGYLLYLFIKRKRFSHATLFMLVWFGVSLFNSFFSHRSYTHYLLLTMPSLILAGALVYENFKKRPVLIIGYVAILVLLYFQFKPYPFTKSLAYYVNFISYLAGQKSTSDYQVFFDPDVPRDYEIAAYLDMKLDKNQEAFIYGNSAQIYVLSNTLPINRYTVAYHINSDEAKKEVQEAINSKRPQYVILLPDQRFSGIYLPNYMYRLNIGQTAIYENIN